MKTVLKPLGIIRARKPEFWLFVVVNGLLAQVGLLASLILIPALGLGDFIALFAAQLDGANFFVFAISMLVAACVPLLLEYVREPDVHFRSLKLFVGLICILLVLTQAFGTGIVLTRAVASRAASAAAETSLSLWTVVAANWLQLVLYLASILVATYVFCVTHLHYDLTTYAGLDDKARNDLERETEQKEVASDGLRLE